MTLSNQRATDQSNETLDARLRAWTAFCFSLGRPLLLLLGFMTLHRFLAWWITPAAFALADNEDLTRAFFIGMRFDLLVLGFFLIPVVLIGSAFVYLGRGFERALFVFIRFLTMAWLVICATAAFDLLFFAVNGRRLTLVDWKAGTDFLSQAWQSQGAGTVIMAVAIVICSWIIGSRELLTAREREFPKMKQRPWPGLHAIRILGPLFVVALMARGTVTAHHLERRHSEISSHQVVNELALNAVWCFDKEPQNR